MCGGDADDIRRLLMYKAQFINGVSLRCVAATFGYVPFSTRPQVFLTRLDLLVSKPRRRAWVEYGVRREL